MPLIQQQTSGQGAGGVEACSIAVGTNHNQADFGRDNKAGHPAS